MSGSDTSDGTHESEWMSEPERLPGDELYMMTGGVYILCSVQRPSTRWITANAIADLSDWQ